MKERVLSSVLVLSLLSGSSCCYGFSVLSSHPISLRRDHGRFGLSSRPGSAFLERGFALPLRKPAQNSRITIKSCSEPEEDEFEILDSSQYTELKSWARKGGTSWGEWDIASFPEYGIRGVVATKAIAEDTPLIQAPLSNSLVVSATSPCPFPKSFADPKLWDEVQGHTARLTLMLLWEARRAWMPAGTAEEEGTAGSSGWELYYECLTQVESEGNGVGWDEVSGDPQNEELLAKLRGIDAAAKAEHAAIKRHMPNPPDLRLWLWARDSVSARTFLLPPSPGDKSTSFALVPLADMFNHEFGNTDVGVRDAGGDVGKLFELRAGRPFREGEQVTISYGAMSNADLLVGYGFVDPENPLDFVTMPLSALKEACDDVPRELLPGEPMEWEGSEKDLKIYKTGEDEQLMACLKRLCGLDRKSTSEQSLQEQCLPWRILARACEMRVLRYPTKLEEDEEELDRLQALMEEEDGGARGVAIHTKSYSLVLYRALQKGLLLECSARVRYFAEKSAEIGKLLDADVMEVQG